MYFYFLQYFPCISSRKINKYGGKETNFYMKRFLCTASEEIRVLQQQNGELNNELGPSNLGYEDTVLDLKLQGNAVKSIYINSEIC